MFLWKKLVERGPRYTKKKSILLIGVSVGCTLGLGIATLVGQRLLRSQHEAEKSATIQKIAQASPSYQALPTVFFAEILGLSMDHPSSFYAFQEREAEAKLLNTFLFKDICVKKLKPHTLFLDYTLRTPLVCVGDFANTLMDDEGVFMPYAPFFTPKRIPKTYFGQIGEKNTWGFQISEEKLQMIKTLLTLLSGHHIEKIDLSMVDLPTLGQRQLIVVLSSNRLNQPTHTLRLSVKNYQQEILNYFKLLKEVLNQEKRPCIIDLRLPQVGYLAFGEENE